MLTQAIALKTHSIEGYLAQEETAEQRHEYVDGEIIPMPGGTPSHSRIILNFAGSLNHSVRKDDYQVFASDQRLWIPECCIYTYPDIFMIREPMQLQEGRKDTVINPILVVEVLSRSTRNYDKDGKFAAYRTIPSFVEYILVEQDKPHVEQYTKVPEGWLMREYSGLEATVSLDAIAFEISLADLYNKVDFAAGDETSDSSI